MAFAVHSAQVLLCLRLAGIGGLAVPVEGLLVVFGNTSAAIVHRAEPELLIAVALLRCLAIPKGGFCKILDDTVALAVHPTELALFTGIALLGKWPPVPQRRRIVSFVIGVPSRFAVWLKALRCDGLRYRNCEDQQGYDGQVSHGLIIGRRVLLPQCLAAVGSACVTHPFRQRQLDRARSRPAARTSQLALEWRPINPPTGRNNGGSRSSTQTGCHSCC